MEIRPSHTWDRTFLIASSYLAEPFCGFWWSVMTLRAPLEPGVLENCSTKTREVARRGLILGGYAAGAALCWAAPVWTLGSIAAIGAGSRALRGIGFALQRDGYTYVRGRAAVKEIHADVSLVSWNICGPGGGLPFDHGGVVSWRYRVDEICNRIIDADADVVVLNEIYDTALCEAIIQRMRNNYAHILCHLGPNSMGSESGVMVLAKCAVHSFRWESFENNSRWLNRGLAILELKRSPEAEEPCARIIGTHLIHGRRQQQRNEQFQQILRACEDTIPTFVAGDLNTSREDRVEGFESSYSGNRPTCTNAGVELWHGGGLPPGENENEAFIDDVLHVQRTEGGVTQCAILPAFGEDFDSSKALSDHQGLIATIAL